MDWYNCIKNGKGPNYLSATLLLVVNILVYYDRYSPTVVIENIKVDLDFTGEKKVGFLQTSQTIALTLMPIISGPLGDRMSRKNIILISLVIWTLSVLISSFAQSYGSFLACQIFAGIGQANFSTMAPTIIADLFHESASSNKSKVSKWIGIFYLAMPIGGGLSFLLVSSIGKNDWRWGIRSSVFPSTIILIMLLAVLKEPPRGRTDADSSNDQTKANQTWQELFSNVLYILSVKSFTISLIGQTFLYFTSGAIMWWGKSYLRYAAEYRDVILEIDVKSEPHTEKEIAGTLGGIFLGAGIGGIIVGTLLSIKLRPKYEWIDPIIMSFAIFMTLAAGIPFILIAHISIKGSLALMFCMSFFMSLTFGITVDMSLYVIKPKVRSTSTGIEMLVAHGFGDAISPYIIGAIADYMGTYYRESGIYQHREEINYSALRDASWITVVTLFISGIFFLISAKFVVSDKRNAETFEIRSGTGSYEMRSSTNPNREKQTFLST